MKFFQDDIQQETKRVIKAGVVGNSLEFYDFSLYGYFAAILSVHFFPEGNPLNALLMTYGIFASGFLMRPIGALFFGYIGDKYGRKKALELSIVFMALPTMLIGLLPVYSTVGITASILLTLMRMLQGFSVGGEMAGSYSFLVEHAPPSRRGFVGSWTNVGSFGGKLLGTLSVGVLSVLLPAEDLVAWGWRIPFIMGLFIAISGFFLRKQVEETPVFKKMKEDQTLVKAPIREAFKTCKAAILQGAGILLVHTVALYLIFVYLPVFLTTEIGLSYQKASFSNFIALLLVIITMPIGAHLSDKMGRKPILFWGTIAITLVAPLAFYLISTGTYPVLLASYWTYSTIFGLMHGPLPAMFTDLFDPKIRYTALSISYNLCVGIFGGMTPFIATWLISTTGAVTAPVYWLMICGVISTIAVSTLKEKPLTAERIQYG